MFCLATIKTLRTYRIAIDISMLLAVTAEALVVVAGNIRCVTKPAKTMKITAERVAKARVPNAAVTAFSPVFAITTWSHSFLQVGNTKRFWTRTDRTAQHSLQPRH